MDIRTVGKKILLDTLVTLPWTGAIAREWDAIEADKRFKAIERQLNDLWSVVGLQPEQPLEESLVNLTRMVDSLGVVQNFGLRKFQSCLVILKEINRRSQFGQANDPQITYEECLQLARDKMSAQDPEKEVQLVIYEIAKTDLIYRHVSLNSPCGWHSVGPKEYFFCATDRIFQPWNPQADSDSIINLLTGENLDSISVEQLDARLGWGARRLNSAIAYLDQNALIHHHYDLGGNVYVLPWIRLSEEAFLRENN